MVMTQKSHPHSIVNKTGSVCGLPASTQTPCALRTVRKGRQSHQEQGHSGPFQANLEPVAEGGPM